MKRNSIFICIFFFLSCQTIGLDELLEEYPNVYIVTDVQQGEDSLKICIPWNVYCEFKGIDMPIQKENRTFESADLLEYKVIKNDSIYSDYMRGCEYFCKKYIFYDGINYHLKYRVNKTLNPIVMNWGTVYAPKDGDLLLEKQDMIYLISLFYNEKIYFSDLMPDFDNITIIENNSKIDISALIPKCDVDRR